MGSGDLGGGGDVEFWRAQAERLAAANVVLRARVAELEGQVGALTEQVSVLARLGFGKSSEKKTTKQAPGEHDQTGGQAGEQTGGGRAGGQEQPRRGQRRGSRGHGRRDYSPLRTREEVHDVPAEDRVCPCCGAGYVRFGEECCSSVVKELDEQLVALNLI